MLQTGLNGEVFQLKIGGEVQLVDELVLKEIVITHPFGNYSDRIKKVTLKKSDIGPSVDVNAKDEVTLYLTGGKRKGLYHRYVLLHEFGHVYDIFDRGFLYTTEARLSLNLDQSKKTFVTDLWNTYIDGRLFSKGLFEFSTPPENVCSSLYKKTITLDSVDSYIEALACQFGLMGFGFEKSKAIIKQVWSSPFGSLTYPFFFEQYDSFFNHCHLLNKIFTGNLIIPLNHSILKRYFEKPLRLQTTQSQKWPVTGQMRITVLQLEGF